MKIVDHLCEPGSSKKPNEDAWGDAGDFIWVLDGATSLIPEPLMGENGDSDARWIAQVVNEYFKAYEYSDFQWQELFNQTSYHVQKLFKDKIGRLPTSGFEEPFAAVRALYKINETRITSCGLSDCVILVETPEGIGGCYGDTVHHEIDQKNLELMMPFLKQGIGFEKAREKLIAGGSGGLVTGRNKANNPDGGYWVFGVRPLFLDHLDIAEFDVVPQGHILLMSDGFYRLVETFGKYNDQTLLDAVKKRGIQSLYDELRALEDHDAMGVEYPRFKKGDDVTAVLVQL